jgi:hypothetical protein
VTEINIWDCKDKREHDMVDTMGTSTLLTCNITLHRLYIIESFLFYDLHSS